MDRTLRLSVLLALVLALVPAPAGAAGLDVQFSVTEETPVSVTIRATISGATGPIQATARVEPLRDGEPVPTVRGLRVDAVERVSEYRHTPLEETKRIPIAEAMTALDAEITALRDTKGLKSEEIDARREERHGKETELAALRSQADHGATFTETTAVVAHEYRLETRERRALVAHCNAGDTITLPPQSWAAPPPSQLLSDTELSLSPTETNWGESTAVYEWTISTGELQRLDGSWGSAGVLVVNINGVDYYDTQNSSWWDSSWPYRMKLTIDNSASTENLIDFPLMVKLTTDRLDYSWCQWDGDDIRFVDSDGTALDYELDTWDREGETFYWVRVPNIPAGSTDDYVWMYYGEPTVASGENAEDVWDSSYVAVYHMNDAPGGLTILDSTSNGNTGTKGAGAAAPTEVDGEIGKAQQFVAASHQFVNCGDIDTTELTVVALAKAASYPAAAYNPLASKGYAPSPGRSWTLSVAATGTKLYSMVRPETWGNIELASDASVALDTWFTGAVAYRSGSHVNALNGVAKTNAAIVGGVYQSNYSVYIGYAEAIASFWDGLIDELRLSSVARSGEWIEAEYLAMWDAMLTYGDTEGYEPEPEEEPVVPLATVLVIVAIGVAAVRQRHIILYTAAFILFLFAGLAAADESLTTGIPIILFAGYMLYALMLTLGGRR